MSAPTARELLARKNHPGIAGSLDVPFFTLAARVEAVLALRRANTGTKVADGYNYCLDDVVRLLNGEQP